MYSEHVHTVQGKCGKWARHIVVHVHLSTLWQGAWSSGCGTHVPLPVCPAVPVGGTSSVVVLVLTRFHPGQTH